MKLKILGVFAHPADMVTEAGGTLAMHADRGDGILAVFLTHGGRIHPNLYAEEQRKRPGERDEGIADADREKVLGIKHAEVEAAARILGVQRLLFLDYEDGMVSVQREMVERLADSIAGFAPHLMVAHHPGFTPGIGNDHCVAGQTAVAAAALAALRLSNLDRKPAHWMAQTYFIAQGVSSRSSITPGGGPVNDLYVDITPVVERKVRALDQFVSQGYDGDYARKCVSGHNGHWGSLAGVPFAEPFMRGSVETHAGLPVAEIDLARDHLGFHRTYSRGANLWGIPVEESPTRGLLREKDGR